MSASDPNLLQRIQTDYLDRTIAGEDKNKLLLFLVCLSASTKRPLSAVVKGVTGAGKSRIVNRVLDIFRRMNSVIEFSRITGLGVPCDLAMFSR
jgi:predicted GTPase